MTLSDDQLDQRLRASGEQWRSAEPELDSINVAALVRGMSGSRPGSTRSHLVRASISLVVVLAVASMVGIYALLPSGRPDGSVVPAFTPTHGQAIQASGSPSVAVSASPNAERSPSPVADQAEAECTTAFDDISMVSLRSGEASVAAAYHVDGAQMTRYFKSILGSGDGPYGNGSSWWDNSAASVYMCVYDGDFQTETPGPPGHDTNATRILVVVDANEAFAWSFCFRSMTSCGISTADPATIGSIPSAIPNGCGPSDLQPFFTVQPTPGIQYGWPLPHVLMDSGKVVSIETARAAMPGLLVPTAVPSDLALQLVLLPPEGSSRNDVELFYAADPVSEDETDWDFHSRRAIFLAQGPTHGQTAQFMEEALGGQFLERGRMVAVGPYYAAVIHDVTYETGDDTYRVYWSDGTTDFWMVASTPPAEAVDVARSMYCDSAPATSQPYVPDELVVTFCSSPTDQVLRDVERAYGLSLADQSHGGGQGQPRLFEITDGVDAKEKLELVSADERVCRATLNWTGTYY
jgi:hypothetical protein